MPDAEKRKRADFIVQTGLSRHHAQRAIRSIVRRFRPA
jgi:dephospho-CoA kinase